MVVYSTVPSQFKAEMDAQGYRRAIAALGMSREGAGRFLHGKKRKTYRGDRRVPACIAMLLSLMLKFGLSPADVCRIAGFSASNYADRRRGRVHVGRRRRFVGKGTHALR